MHCTRWALALAPERAGSNKAARIAMIAITTSNSINVNAMPPPRNCRLRARLKTSCLPRKGTRPTRFPRESACIVGPVPAPGGFFNGLLGVMNVNPNWPAGHSPLISFCINALKGSKNNTNRQNRKCAFAGTVHGGRLPNRNVHCQPATLNFEL